MGNNNSREGRPSHSGRHQSGDVTSNREVSNGDNPLQSHSSRRQESRRHDFGILGQLSDRHGHDPDPNVRKETKAERDARRLERERVARAAERERSMREEHVDGGYLVTQGVYTGTEDFSKPVVRQLMIERRIAPFWRGLNDFDEKWTEYQLFAAAKGLPIPAPDEKPPEAPVALPDQAQGRLSSSPQTLTVPIPGRTNSHSFESPGNLSESHPAFSLPSPSSQTSSSPFRPRSKTLASLTSKNISSGEMVPREIQLPADPYVNGQLMEAFLYKDATECPICFIYYPPYLNSTRCCDQPICSECFVQIKRPDPHTPEQDHGTPSATTPPPVDQAESEMLVSEPANCPYCQQQEFGVTYEPPPFRRGLAYASGAGQTHGSALSSSTSLTPGSPSARPVGGRRRTTSISANDSNVITTDRVRPDWATKLANARNHAARRAAAATALHTAAYLMGNGAGDSRGFGFSSRSRFGRNRDSPTDEVPAGLGPDMQSRLAAFSTLAEQQAERQRDAREGGRRRSRMDDLEDMMMMEAIRLSIAAEEERKRKEEKEAAKKAKKEAKEAKKAEKAAKKNPYGHGSTSASGSALSLALSGLGRKRDNSGSSSLAKEVSSNNKGKSVERPGSSSAGPPAPSRSPTASSGQHLEVGGYDGSSQGPGPSAPEKPSHLRQMSNASSPASSTMESAPASRNGYRRSTSSFESPSASNAHLAGSSEERNSGDTSNEPMFNFTSLAQMVSKDEAKDEDNLAHVEYADHMNGRERGESSQDPEAGLEQSTVTLRPDTSMAEADADALPTPEVMVTPVSPAAVDKDSKGKQLGEEMNFGHDDGIQRQVS